MSAGAQTPPANAGRQQIVVFSLAAEQYALPISAVSEIIRHTTLRSVASDTPSVRGVIGLRGKIILVIDVITRLGLTSADAEPGEAAKIVILDAEGSQAGVCVDAVDEVLTVTDDQLEAVPVAGSAIDAVVKLDDRLVMLIDAASLLAEPAAHATAH